MLEKIELKDIIYVDPIVKINYLKISTIIVTNIENIINLILTFFPMRGKKYIFCLFVIILFLTSPFALASSHSSIKKSNDSDLVKIGVYQVYRDGKIEETVKKLTNSQCKNLMEKLQNQENSSISLNERYNTKIDVLKEYNLIPLNTTAEDILEERIIKNTFAEENELIINQPFAAHFAPIIIGGLGFGVSIGLRGFPLLKRIAGNIFFAGFIVGGGVFCFDPATATPYFLYSLIYPTWTGFIAGFVGIMLFVFDDLIPIPMFNFYSNFFAMGLAGFTFWIEPSFLTPQN